ncbi:MULTISPECIES: rhamnulokinase family protein [unclassified Paenibacillus]|uniref:rhamnulokinase n=1 Tax=unclassified Paenibacillus TaxID=185978 RepID=UPI0009563783|nr:MULTISPECIES: rhamnulokinase family protein [unclassified Paenibacillus]ASS65461.1 rhamnulokinase [Paenibacillus sp. RUD330]SIQ35465.1 rhamnulokinase [Paenibacillus sp. RU4X]SIQ57371.1 rhamnulokinase [Paenibacillus sp. RU4T]
MSDILAFDLGAGSGRAIAGRIRGGRIETTEIHRFRNEPVLVAGRLHWNLLGLHQEIKNGLRKTLRQGIPVSSLAIDSWAVDFGFIGADGALLGNPLHYRDEGTLGMMDEVTSLVSAQEIFSRTGIQFQPFNTIYQLYGLVRRQSPQLAAAERMLMIPELLRYFLTGEAVGEFTTCSTTQLFNPSTMDWDGELIAKLGLSPSWFGRVAQPGSAAGSLQASVRKELGAGPIAVFTAAEHDTASAVVAVPSLQRNFAYLSCGTWSLLGTELDAPILSEEARSLNFTNEGGACGTFRLLKNIMGLWLLQESRREWERAGLPLEFPELVCMAAESMPFASLIDPDAPSFLPPGDMPGRIRAYCEATGQRAPRGPGATARCILESLALKYRQVLEQTEQLSGQAFDGLHMVGGGIHNELLCQWTANAIGRPVWAGPAEGSAIGNLAVQWIASGELGGLGEARGLIRDSFPVQVYEPRDPEAWDEAFGRFKALIG